MNEKVTCEDCRRFNAKNNVCALLEKTVRPGYGCYEGEPRIITNGDRIRQMSDEELAEYLWQVGDTVSCPGAPGHWKDWKCPVEETTGPCDSYGCWLDWIKQEAQDE